LRFGAHKFFLGADVNGDQIVISGWTEKTDIVVYDLIQKYIELGLTKVFCTDVNKDGMMEGPSTELYKNIIKKFPDLKFVASGGISSIDDLHSLQEIGCKGVIIGKAIYEGKIELKELLAISNQHSA